MPQPVRHAHARPATVALALAAAIAVAAGAAVGFSAGNAADARAGAAPVVEDAPNGEPTPSSPAPTASSAPSPSATPTEEAERDVRFTLVAGGDVLTHMPVNDSAATEDGYDFTPLFAGLRPYLEGADLAICHLEVPVSPGDTPPSGYPVFSAPSALVRDLKEVGWDGCSTASNHSVDKGVAGVESTLAAFDANLLQHAGTARTEDESEQVAYYAVQDGDRTVKVAHLSFAYGTNGMPVSQPWEVDLFDADDADASPIIDAAQRARDDGADVVIASVHCCVEYRTEPTDAQRSLATQIAESGLVDLYIGHHAHVPQPIELLPGGPSGEGMWTAFGLGNLLSNQDSWCCAPETANGVLLDATFTVTPDGAVSVDAGWVATTVDRRDGHSVRALADIADGAGTLSAADVAARHALVRDAVGDQPTEVTEPPASLAEHAFALLRPAPGA
ncbi:CapA family protein [Demequina iriomotensis]|uniref:CapA family protein n=1 Tax=Demequina iriomotensis TaxID=1536641 RepID=UPI000782D0CF|nr:CapA family protein [Demequina iriomotensis]